MRLLCFHAKRFAWRPFERTLETAADAAGSREVENAVIAFIQVEATDLEGDREVSVFRQALKHLKWLANRRQLRCIVLHSFAHLGGGSVAADQAHTLLIRLSERLTANGYVTAVTPFGYSNEWELEVFGDGGAKVWKMI